MTDDSGTLQVLVKGGALVMVLAAISALDKALGKVGSVAAEIDAMVEGARNAQGSDALATAADRARNMAKALKTALGAVALTYLSARLETGLSKAVEAGEEIGFFEENAAKATAEAADAAERASDAVEQLAQVTEEDVIIRAAAAIESVAEAIKAAETAVKVTETAIRIVTNKAPQAEESSAAIVAYLLSALDAAVGRANIAAGTAMRSIRPHGEIEQG